MTVLLITDNGDEPAVPSGHDWRMEDLINTIEDQYDNTVDFEPMRCGPHQEDWR